MKLIESITEWIIIVLGYLLIVLPEIAYSLVIRARDWLTDRVIEL